MKQLIFQEGDLGIGHVLVSGIILYGDDKANPFSYVMVTGSQTQ